MHILQAACLYETVDISKFLLCVFFLSDTCNSVSCAPWRSRANFVPPLPANSDHQHRTDSRSDDLARVCCNWSFWVKTKQTSPKTKQMQKTPQLCKSEWLVFSSQVFPVLFYPVLYWILPRHNPSLSILQQGHLHLQANVLNVLLWQGQQWWLHFNCALFCHFLLLLPHIHILLWGSFNFISFLQNRENANILTVLNGCGDCHPDSETVHILKHPVV